MRSRVHIQSHPLHPILVAFPLALWSVSLIFDLLGLALHNPTLWAAGFYAIIAGTVGAAFAALPGIIDWLTIVPPQSSAKKTGFIHGTVNSLVVILFIVEAVRRGAAVTPPDRASVLISVLGVLLLGYSGWLGGTLVYRNQIGVDHRYANAGSWKERTITDWKRPACNVGELAQGQMMLTIIAGERVVIGKCPEGVVAFSDHCTHNGGTLADGVLIGCAVQCPWHGSQFDVHNGRVISGPAQKQIKTYATRVHDGEVYVSPLQVTERKQA
ncbi:MAG: Rieske (2Fe-2S) oxidoreductase [Candidatus Angelobacter sp.]|jgi:uncharacterized membrane protein/nitrite reductase/ring-hydroxylating ferredoxin subunit|nr:Rieske (2Fe-2S) oxidoreductase [Candidatus Angelobacter sp.]